MIDRPMMTCDEVDGMLLDHLEETLDRASRAAVDRHVASCVRCSAMMRDLGTIRFDAERLPELAPSRDLWQRISERIAPAVLPLSVPSRPAMPRRWMPLAAAAAAALVIGTAGITYVATSRSLAPSPTAVAVVTRQAPAVSETPAANAPEEVQSGSPGVESVRGAPATAAAATQQAQTTRPEPRAGALVSRPSRTPTSPSDVAYGDEIRRLQNIITERRRELDPATISVIEESLRIIDAAVRQSRAALARDPRSVFLVDQLNNALDKKVELLRTVALLPSRT